ncbi:LacI family DNA-binding transcriptional regulator [Bariatricus massiliensis]|nr:LacI family DNA-binding transcriptional regulator [Bariatricus massiliensis]
MRKTKCKRLQKGCEKMVTISDIAKELNLSISTVSRAFTNPEMVKEVTRKQIIEKADEMGYQVNMIASQLRNKSSKLIALVSLQPRMSWFTDDLLNGAQEYVREEGYEIVTLNAHNAKVDSISICERMRFAGIIIAATELGRDVEVKRSKMLPTVYVNRMSEEGNNILTDDAAGISDLMDYLYSIGHRKIGYISGPENSLNSVIRLNTFKKKMQEYDLPVRDEWIERGEWMAEDAREAARNILSLPEYPTVLVAANDQMCIGVYQAIQEKGLVVGRDISVAGYDNTEFSQWMNPPLTTVSLPLYEMGQIAARTLLMKIEGKEEIKKEQIVRGELIIRESTRTV